MSDIDLLFDPATVNNNTGDIGTGIQFGGKSAGETLDLLEVNRMRVVGIHNDWPLDKYWNGDGLTTERTNAMLRVNHLTVIDAPDGAIDSKSRKSELSNIYGERVRSVLKLWNDASCDKITGINPVVQGPYGCSHLRLMGSSTRPPVMTFTDCYFVGNAPLARLENGPVLFHGTGKFEGPKMFDRHNGGTLAPGSTWNGEAIA